jgi:tyrosine-protein phosphatase YwqE
MLHFFKSKPLLKDLIPEGYIDIHSHLLPGIDDGAATLEETVALIQGLRKIGFEQWITTPHTIQNVWNNTKSEIETKLDYTIEALKAKNLAVPLKAASEYMMDASFMTLFQKEPLLTLKDRYVLVEISYINPPLQLYDILFELQLAGYQPVLAHPERYPFYHGQTQHYQKLKQAGCLFQLNLLSTTGYYGPEVAKAGDQLLKKGMIDFVGSDVHHQNHLQGFYKKIIIQSEKELKIAIAGNQFFRF